MQITTNGTSNKRTGNKLAAAAGLATVLAFSPLFSPLANAGSKHKHSGGFGTTYIAPHSEIAHFTDYAKVTHVEPVYKRVRHQKPKQQCWYEQPEYTTHYNGHNSHHQRSHPAQTIVGGIVGGVIGNQLGRHTGSRKGRFGATVAGAIVGSALANEGHSRHRGPRPAHNPGYTVTESRPVKHCKQVYETQYKQKVVGYNVTYRYRGRTHTTHMQHRPGHRLPVNVSISPQG